MDTKKVFVEQIMLIHGKLLYIKLYLKTLGIARVGTGYKEEYLAPSFKSIWWHSQYPLLPDADLIGSSNLEKIAINFF